ncbi:hypothetical protein E4U53_004523, partial [Claviceps sorghi]
AMADFVYVVGEVLVTHRQPPAASRPRQSSAPVVRRQLSAEGLEDGASLSNTEAAAYVKIEGQLAYSAA